MALQMAWSHIIAHSINCFGGKVLVRDRHNTGPTHHVIEQQELNLVSCYQHALSEHYQFSHKTVDEMPVIVQKEIQISLSSGL